MQIKQAISGHVQLPVTPVDGHFDSCISSFGLYMVANGEIADPSSEVLFGIVIHAWNESQRNVSSSIFQFSCLDMLKLLILDRHGDIANLQILLDAVQSEIDNFLQA